MSELLQVPKSPMLFKIKDWIKYKKPLYEFCEEIKIRRLSDGSIFGRFYYCYKYKVVNGQQLVYEISSFCTDMRCVYIDIFNDIGTYIGSLKISIDCLPKPEFT